MYKKFFLSFLALILTASFASVNLASDKGNGRKGKYLFRKSCRSCHAEGATAVELSPISKTQAEWEKVFAADAYKTLSCQAEWDKRSQEDIADIYAYMYDHAFDSPSPAKCK
jgi:cytochrome c2